MATREFDILAAINSLSAPARNVLASDAPPEARSIPGLGASRPQNPELRVQDPRPPQLPVVEANVPQPPLIRVPDHEPEIFAALAELQRMAGGRSDALDQDVGIMAIRLDRASGAPSGARFAVSSVSSPMDRLNAVRARYPMAVPVEGTSNFIYLDPATGDPVLFDEDGPSFRDLADMAPALAEGAGAVLGGAGGAAMGGLPGAAAGAGLGGAVGRRIAQVTGQNLTGAVDTRPEAAQALESAGAAGTGAAMTLAGPAVGAAARGVGNMLARASALTRRNLTAQAGRIERALRTASGQSPDDVARAAREVAGREGPAATAYHLATKAPDAAQPALQLRQLRSDLGPNTWDAVAGNAWAELADTGAGTSVEAFAQNWKALRPGVRRELFGGTRYHDAGQLMDGFASRVAGAGKIRNATSAAKKVLNPLVGGLGLGFATGGPVGAVIGGAVGGATRATLRNAIPNLLSSPSFMQWVTRGVDIANRSPGAVPSLMLRLPVIAQREPWLAESLQALYPEAFDVSAQAPANP